ncbi:unnamed protein product, partial [marine sediment metagenome]
MPERSKAVHKPGGDLPERADRSPRAIVIESCRDITERRLAEDQLRKEKDLSEATLSSLPGVFYAFDGQGNFLRWNKNFETVSGYSGEEIAG